MLEQMMYWVIGLCVLATIYIVFFKQEFAEIGFSSLGVLLSVTMFIYALFDKFTLIYGEIAYAVSCILFFYSVEISIKIFLNTLKKIKLEKTLHKIKTGFYR